MKEINNLTPPPPTSVEVLTPSALAEVFYFSRNNTIYSIRLPASAIYLHLQDIITQQLAFARAIENIH